ncbi:MAG: ABC transporter ATP-binding protein [Gordonia sp. (in: high G+C Gram-positive bacteria)]|uniref:ABC transporter ATP-binding protein n=1 Tax=Gordonia sp. (in: high G+C Gram-positive bacteria) TaxID=84139 RepID=UPI0039E40F53
MNTAPAIEAHQLTKSFSGPDHTRVQAVQGIDLRIDSGEVVAFLGPNGAGKTTTLDMIQGLTRPDSGTVEVFGGDPRAAARAGKVASVLQTGGLLPDFTVEETISIIASPHGRPEEAGPTMERTGIADLAGRKISRCSGGEQQRVKFALATLPDPELLILDEPTAGMDVEARRHFWSVMRDDAARGRTVLFATHYLEEADSFADRIVLIAGGRVVADGPTSEIRNRASRRTVSAVLAREKADAVVATLPDAQLVEERGGRVYLSAADSDALARYLFTSTDAHDVEIAAHNLEDAFVTLTADAR